MKLGPRQQKLVDALRSGDYKQGKTYLKSLKGYCCLGVACDLYSKETGDGMWADFKQSSDRFIDKTKRSVVSSLSQNVQDYYKFKTDLGSFKEFIQIKNCCHNSLADMNDNGLSFETIADFIEDDPAVVFEESR